MQKKIDKDALFVIIVGILMTAAVFLPVVDMYNSDSSNAPVVTGSDIYIEMLEDNSYTIDLNDYFLEGWGLVDINAGEGIDYVLNDNLLTVIPGSDWNGQESLSVQVGYLDMEFHGKTVTVRNRQICEPAVGDGTERGPFALGYPNIISAEVWSIEQGQTPFKLVENDDYVMDYNTGEIWMASWGSLLPGERLTATYTFSLQSNEDRGFARNEVLCGSAVGNGLESQFNLEHGYISDIDVYVYDEDSYMCWHQLSEPDYILDPLTGELFLKNWGPLDEEQILVANYNFTKVNPEPGYYAGGIIAGPGTGLGNEDTFELEHGNIVDFTLYSIDGDSWELVPDNEYFLDVHDGVVYMTDWGPLFEGEFLRAFYNYTDVDSGYVAGEVVCGPGTGYDTDFGPYALGHDGMDDLSLYSFDGNSWEIVPANEYITDEYRGEIYLTDWGPLQEGEFLFAFYNYSEPNGRCSSEVLYGPADGNGLEYGPYQLANDDVSNLELYSLTSDDSFEVIPPDEYTADLGLGRVTFDDWGPLEEDEFILAAYDYQVSSAPAETIFANFTPIQPVPPDPYTISTSWQNFTLNVLPVNDAPCVDRTAPTFIVPPDLTLEKVIDLDQMFTDIDSDLQYSWSTQTGDTHLSIDAENRLSIEAGQVAGIADTISIMASDGEQHVTTDLHVITMAPNQETFDEDTTTSCTLSPLAKKHWDLLGASISDNMSYDFPSRDTVRFTPASDWNGEAEFLLAAGYTLTPISLPIDPIEVVNRTRSDQLSFTSSLLDYSIIYCLDYDLVVSAVNDMPTSVAIPDKEMNEDAVLESALNLNDYFSDIDSQLQFEAVSANENINVDVDASGTVGISAGENWFGTGEVTFTASDGEYSVSKAMDIVVWPQNDPPSALGHIDEAEIAEDNSLDMDLSGYFTDVDDTVAFSYIADDNLTVELNETTGLATIEPAADWFGSAEVTFYASDAEYSASQAMKLRVTPVNDMPEASSTLSTVEFDEDATSDVDMSTLFTDIDSSLTFSATSSDTNLRLAVSPETGALELSATPDWSGPATVQMFATDGEYVASQSVYVNVMAVNDPPQLLDNDIETGFMEDSVNEISLGRMFSDVDSQLTFTTTSTSQLDVTVDEIYGLMSIAPTANWYGSSDVTVTADDGEYKVSRTLNCQVFPVNDAPYLQESLPQVVIEGEDSIILDLRPYYSDADGDPLSFDIQNSPNLVINRTETEGIYEISSHDGWTGAETLVVSVSDGTASYEMPISMASMPASDTSSSSVTGGGSESMMMLALAVCAIGMIAVTATARRQMRGYRN